MNKETTDSLRFQLSLLKLAVVPHGAARSNPGSVAANELVKLAKKIPAANHKQARAQK